MRIDLVFSHRMHQNVHTVCKLLTSFSNVDKQSRKAVHTNEEKNVLDLSICFYFSMVFPLR